MALAPKRTLLIGGILAGGLVLYVLGNDNRPGQTGDTGGPAANTTQCRVTSTVDGLRIRSGPGVDTPIVDRLSRGEQIDADKVVENGWRKVGENRWVSTEFIQPLPGRDCG